MAVCGPGWDVYSNGMESCGPDVGLYGRCIGLSVVLAEMCIVMDWGAVVLVLDCTRGVYGCLWSWLGCV